MRERPFPELIPFSISLKDRYYYWKSFDTMKKKNDRGFSQFFPLLSIALIGKLYLDYLKFDLSSKRLIPSLGSDFHWVKDE